MQILLLYLKLKAILLSEQTMEDCSRVLEKVFVLLHVQSVHDAVHQSLLDGRRLTLVMLHAVTHIPQRLDDQQTQSAAANSSRTAELLLFRLLLCPYRVSILHVPCRNLI